MYGPNGWVDQVVNAWDAKFAVAGMMVGVMLYGVWQVWRGLRIDRFQSNLRTLCQRPGHRFMAASAPNVSHHSARLQVSLLPLLLLSTALAILLAQAQRPDDISRAGTWLLFVIGATLYGIQRWGAWRGLGPLRNEAFAGTAAAAGCSLLLWSFYGMVDYCEGLSYGASSTRLTPRLPQMLWWTALGAAIGASLGSMFGQRRGHQLEVTPQSDAELTAAANGIPTIDATTNAQGRHRWGGVVVGCAASCLIHLAAAPQIPRLIQPLGWGDQRRQPTNDLTLTMTPVRQPDSLLSRSSTTVQVQPSSGLVGHDHFDDGSFELPPEFFVDTVDTAPPPQTPARLEAKANLPAEGRQSPFPEAPLLELEGYCPVTLITMRKWVAGGSRLVAVHQNRRYLFADEAAKRTFLAAPDRYAPMFSGYDPVVYSKTGRLARGNRRFGLTFRGRMLLFESELSLLEFSQTSEQDQDNFLNSLDRLLDGTTPQQASESARAPGSDQPPSANRQERLDAPATSRATDEREQGTQPTPFAAVQKRSSGKVIVVRVSEEAAVAGLELGDEITVGINGPPLGDGVIIQHPFHFRRASWSVRQPNGPIRRIPLPPDARVTLIESGSR